MIRSKIAAAVFIALVAMSIPAIGGESTELGLAVKVTVFAGFPTPEAPGAAGKLLVPGVVLVPGTSPQKNPSAEDLAERFKSTFGLAKVEASPSANMFLQPGGEETVNTTAGKLDIQVRLIQYTVGAAAFEVAILDGGKKLGEAKLIVDRGSQGIMGGRNGDAAPYFFVVLEPQVALPPPAPGIHRSDEAGITPPKLVHRVNPVYPEEARKAGVSGVVIVSALVGEDGTIQNVEVMRPLEKGCTEAAVAAVKQWRYEPARSESTGKPVKVYFTVTIAFRLQ